MIECVCVCVGGGGCCVFACSGSWTIEVCEALLNSREECADD